MTAVNSKRRAIGAMREAAARELAYARKAAICLENSIAATEIQVHGSEVGAHAPVQDVISQYVTAIPLAAAGLLAVDLVEPTSRVPGEVVSKL